jgi:hypothetical protein
MKVLLSEVESARYLVPLYIAGQAVKATLRKSAMNAEHEFARSWFPTFEQVAIREIEAAGLGEHSWAVRGGRDDAGFVEIGWTRGNLVLAVYVSCYPCHADVTDAARRWAEAIDSLASKGRLPAGHSVHWRTSPHSLTSARWRRSS